VRILEFGTLEAILACTGAGLGVTLLPRGLVENARRAGQVGVHALPPEDAFVDTVFARRRDAYVSSALAAFLAAVRPAWATARAAE
jgi:LysR family transcriptional regulator, cell division regulator